MDGEIESYVDRLDYNKDGKVSFEKLAQGFDALRYPMQMLQRNFSSPLMSDNKMLYMKR